MEIFECTKCDWVGTTMQMESHEFMPPRYDPPDPGEYQDKCPHCGSIESMEEIPNDDLCDGCAVVRKHKHGADFNSCWPCMCEAAEARHELAIDR